MECQSTQDILEGKIFRGRAFVYGKICQRQHDSTVISFQLLLDLLLYGYNSHAGALWRKCLRLLQSFSRQKWSWSANIRACYQQGLEQDFHSAKTGTRLFSQCSSLKKYWRLTTSCSRASPCHTGFSLSVSYLLVGSFCKYSYWLDDKFAWCSDATEDTHIFFAFE